MRRRGSCSWRSWSRPAGTAGISGSVARRREAAVLYDQVQQAVQRERQGEDHARRHRHGRQVRPHGVRADDARSPPRRRSTRRATRRREGPVAMGHRSREGRRVQADREAASCARAARRKGLRRRPRSCSPSRRSTRSRASWRIAAATCSRRRASATMRAPPTSSRSTRCRRTTRSARQLIQFKLDALGG